MSLNEAMARLPRVVDLLAARADEHDREAAFPYRGVEALHEAGLLTLTVGTEHGGVGAGVADTVRLLAALGGGDPSVALLAADTLLTHAAQARAARWPAAAYKSLLADSRRGPALVGSLRAAEGGAGVTASRGSEGWLLTGREQAVPGAEALAWMTVEARLEDTAEERATFLVPGDSPGVAVEPGWEQLGLRAGAVQDVHFEKVQAQDAHRLASPTPRDEACRRLAIAAVCLGIGGGAHTWLARNGRGLPASELGRVALELAEAEELLNGIAGGLDADLAGADRRAAWLAPGIAQRGLSVVQRVVALSGATGLSRVVPLERHLRDAVSVRALLPREDVVLHEAGSSPL
ncbi:acyl-CoA dehydrogenase family protein [Streptacidiphilus rugosus]|uniref:acyl-CoA dehydrogenase family protein n=1 Tax=Streptacidiphilus rugosus TaxID=405783 RepID=UPI00056537B2|nr:acyl-CoA dehydrogenase family protein [Streptacidiphilus rugosus]